MKATITYLLTEQAQREALLDTGQPTARKQTTEIDVTPEDAEFCTLDANTGALSIDLTYRWGDYRNALLAAGVVDAPNEIAQKGQAHLALDQVPKVFDLIRAGKVIMNAKAAEKKAVEKAAGERNAKLIAAARERFFADQSARIDDYSNPWAKLGVSLEFPSDPPPAVDAEWAAEGRRRNAADQAAKEAAEAAKEAAKTEYIAQWVKNHGEPELRAQYDDGLLDRKVVLAIIAEEAFTAAGVPDEYDPPEFCRASCPCGRRDVSTIPPAAYRAFRAWAKSLSEGTAYEFERIVECNRSDDDDDSDAEPFHAVLVKMPVGPFTFERLVKL